jgi:hypothetical protein
VAVDEDRLRVLLEGQAGVGHIVVRATPSQRAARPRGAGRAARALSWLRMRGCAWEPCRGDGKDPCSSAAAHGHLVVLRWARAGRPVGPAHVLRSRCDGPPARAPVAARQWLPVESVHYVLCCS